MNTIDLIERALNVRAFYHRLLAGNVANMETPGFKEKDIDFKKEMEKKVALGPAGIDVIEKTDDLLPGTDGNTVNMEKQTAKITENSLMFNALVQVVSRKFAMMRYVINEGRR